MCFEGGWVGGGGAKLWEPEMLHHNCNITVTAELQRLRSVNNLGYTVNEAGMVCKTLSQQTSQTKTRQKLWVNMWNIINLR